MDHSLHGYLERQSTQTLVSFLTYCLQEANYANYEYAILEILSVLNARIALGASLEAMLPLLSEEALAERRSL